MVRNNEPWAGGKSRDGFRIKNFSDLKAMIAIGAGITMLRYAPCIPYIALKAQKVASCAYNNLPSFHLTGSKADPHQKSQKSIPN